MLNSSVLVLNENYQPINVCNVKRAFILLHLGKAELVIRGTDTIRSMRIKFPSPSVIRLMYMIKLPNIKRRLSRQAIFHRDGFACQYCGGKNDGQNVTSLAVVLTGKMCFHRMGRGKEVLAFMERFGNTARGSIAPRGFLKRKRKCLETVEVL